MNRWDEEAKQVLSWWSSVTIVYRFLLVYTPRNKRGLFSWMYPPKMNIAFWSLEEKIFGSAERMTRVGFSTWEDIQTFLKGRLLK